MSEKVTYTMDPKDLKSLDKVAEILDKLKGKLNREENKFIFDEWGPDLIDKAVNLLDFIVEKYQ